MNLQRILYSQFGKTIISILLGLGLASLFRKACHDRSCLTFVGPPMDEIKDKTFNFDNKCYSYTPKAMTCNAQKKQVRFSDTIDITS